MKKFLFSIETKPERCPLPCEPASATVSFLGNPTLHQLAEGLLGAVGFDLDHPFGFYSNLNTPYGKCDEKYIVFSDIGEPEDGEPGVNETRAENVFSPGKKMLFLFDYGDDWHFLVECLELEDIGGNAKAGTWSVVSTEGNFPEQYPEFK